MPLRSAIFHFPFSGPKSRSFSGVACLLLCALLSLPLGAQSPRPTPLTGAAELSQTLDQLNTLGSVLMLGAHPDDENTAVIAYFARGRHMRTAYLSATRGEGGQNLIGTEQAEQMGLIRTQELLAAPPYRRGRAVLHAGNRFRLLEKSRGSTREMGPRASAQRHGPRHPALPARRRHLAVLTGPERRSRTAYCRRPAFNRGV